MLKNTAAFFLIFITSTADAGALFSCCQTETYEETIAPQNIDSFSATNASTSTENRPTQLQPLSTLLEQRRAEIGEYKKWKSLLKNKLNILDLQKIGESQQADVYKSSTNHEGNEEVVALKLLAKESKKSQFLYPPYGEFTLFRLPKNEHIVSPTFYITQHTADESLNYIQASDTQTTIDTHTLGEYQLVATISPFIQGLTLDQFAQKDLWNQKLDEQRRLIIKLATQFCCAVKHIHKHGYAHRDLKPENCIFDREAEKLTLFDFGLSREADKSMEKGCGSYHTMSPEILTGNPYSIASDAFSLGAIFFMLVFRTYPGYIYTHTTCHETEIHQEYLVDLKESLILFTSLEGNEKENCLSTDDQLKNYYQLWTSLPDNFRTVTLSLLCFFPHQRMSVQQAYDLLHSLPSDYRLEG